MKKDAKAWKIIVIVFVLLFILVMSFAVLFVLFNKPTVDPEIPWDTTPPETESSSETETSVLDGVVAPTISDYSRKDGVYNFLVIGKDDIAFNTDVILIISFDTVNYDISVMQIPRDTYIDAALGSHKINAAYATYYVRALRNDKDTAITTGLADFSKFIEQNLNVKIDYYALVNLAGLGEIVDALGGVEVDVPEDMYYKDPEQNLYIDIKKGTQILDGKNAQHFIRFRSGYLEGDLGRVKAQKIFLSAFLAQIKTSLNLKTLVPFVTTALEHVTTNISLTDLLFFAKEAYKVDLENVNFFTLPGIDAREYVDSGAWYYVMKKQDTLNIINAHFNVFNTDISSDIFDINGYFTSTDKPHLHSIYTSPATEDVSGLGTSAESIENNSLDIPRAGY